MLTFATLFCLALDPGGASSSPSLALAPSHQIAVNITYPGAELSYAFRIASNWTAGLMVGANMDFFSAVVIGGRHATESWGVSYGDKDGQTDKQFWEGMGGGLFLRRWLPYGFQTDVGVRATRGSHFDSSDDDAGDASFKGLFGSLFWGNQYIAAGARVSAGLFSEPRSGDDLNEAVVIVAPLNLRLALPW